MKFATVMSAEQISSSCRLGRPELGMGSFKLGSGEPPGSEKSARMRASELLRLADARAGVWLARGELRALSLPPVPVVVGLEVADGDVRAKRPAATPDGGPASPTDPEDFSAAAAASSFSLLELAGNSGGRRSGTTQDGIG